MDIIIIEIYEYVIMRPLSAYSIEEHPQSPIPVQLPHAERPNSIEIPKGPNKYSSDERDSITNVQCLVKMKRK